MSVSHNVLLLFTVFVSIDFARNLRGLATTHFSAEAVALLLLSCAVKNPSTPVKPPYHSKTYTLTRSLAPPNHSARCIFLPALDA